MSWIRGCSDVTCADVKPMRHPQVLCPTDRLRGLLPSCRVVKEFGIKACRECRFSHGGQMFAAVSGNTIGVYNTFTCEVVGNLRQAHVIPLPGMAVGHTSSVKHVLTDQSSVSCTMAGSAAQACLVQDAAHICSATVVRCTVPRVS